MPPAVLPIVDPLAVGERKSVAAVIELPELGVFEVKLPQTLGRARAADPIRSATIAVAASAGRVVTATGLSARAAPGPAARSAPAPPRAAAAPGSRSAPAGPARC